jgi:hypothetical protein
MAWIGRPPDTTAPGGVAVLAQSGSIADAFLSLGGRVGFRCVVSSGAEAVTDAADYLRFFAEDEGTRAVGLFLETVRRPDAFADALERCALAEKTVVCLKVGRSEAGARAALSHTGALVGSRRAFSAVLRRYSAVEVDDFHELVETLELLGRGGRPRGTRIGGISESGGECALLADHAEAAGIPFPPLPPELAARLRSEFPNYLEPGNPLDAWAVADESVVYPRSLELLAGSGAFDVLVAQVDLSQFRDETNDGWCELTLRALASLRARTGVFVAATALRHPDWKPPGDHGAPHLVFGRIRLPSTTRARPTSPICSHPTARSPSTSRRSSSSGWACASRLAPARRAPNRRPPRLESWGLQWSSSSTGRRTSRAPEASSWEWRHPRRPRRLREGWRRRYSSRSRSKAWTRSSAG